ncbi:helix-turn-helix domain-containing protein [Pseudalkalibacillus decolorationis]|uniref:helix-turn-helix domain-containing protein n=1 Tax=Pseudalkalibacillus decolorationis TaxID=163879 RepID=UPI0021489B03|nr:helix-turn-helix domain-containing protein [Pseudalkalibacillus decolorationis]
MHTYEEALKKKAAFIIENQKEWYQRGLPFKEAREEKGLPMSFVANELGISPGRLKRFENGDPVSDSRLIEKAYKMWLDNWNLTGEMQRTLNRYR